MQEVNINSLIDNECLDENIPNDIIIVGKIDKLNIQHKYDLLDLSKIECNKIYYQNQKGESIKNHILPNSLKLLYIVIDNMITSLPDHLPDSLEGLYCCGNYLSFIHNLPKSLKELYCSCNDLNSLPELPNSLERLGCSFNNLISLPELPNSLERLDCIDNQLISLPNFSHINNEILLYFSQDNPISYIPYNKNLKLYNIEDNKINIEGYPDNPITDQEELNKYMKYIKNYEMNRIKSARK